MMIMLMMITGQYLGCCLCDIAIARVHAVHLMAVKEQPTIRSSQPIVC